MRGLPFLTDLQFALKFVCPFIIDEHAFFGDEVENLLLVTVVADLSSNQLAVPYYTPHVWPALKKEIPLVLNFAVHFFLTYLMAIPLLMQLALHFAGELLNHQESEHIKT